MDSHPGNGRAPRLADELACREFVEFLHAYVGDELGPTRRALFDRHLALCPDCRAYLESYRQTIELGRLAMTTAAGPSELPVPPDLIRAILAAREG